MSNVVKAQSLPVASMSDLASAGQLLARSGMFGIRNEAEGFVVLVTCHQRGITIPEFFEDYHIVHGRPSKKADAILASLVDLGGEYEILSRTPERAAIKASRGKTSGVFELTWADAQLEPFPYVGKESEIVEDLARGQRPQLKDKYATPRSRMQMLWARVVSDAVRAVCPQACKGTYTPEEVGDFADPQPQQPHSRPQRPEPCDVTAEVEQSQPLNLDTMDVDALRQLYSVADQATKAAIIAEVERRNEQEED